ncbi:TPA: hypothetical protein L3I95_003692 [Enterobacter cloacae]|nr:hypothetical protein [Enterobacter cloacae]
MKLFEMEGFLRGKCLPGDMKVNETNAQYLVRKFAEADAKCAALAAELQSVKAMNDCLSEELRGYESDGAFEGPKMHLLWWQCETPNHDAFLAEVRASAVDEACLKISNAIVNCYQDEQIGLDAAATICGDFASLIRKGVQS